ncbi:MAG: hypothetical protein PHO58_04745 [Bacilli bacterium]|nr:hypothetical protein [Bacilli bacterium]
MFEKVYNENLFIMKLLTTQPEFLDDVQKIRVKLKIPTQGFTTEKDKNKWLGSNLKSLFPGKRSLQDSKGVFYQTGSLVKKYQLRYNFLPYIESYIFYSKIDAPKFNFDISLGPDPSGLRHDKWVSLKAYSPLTKDEIREATKKLKDLQLEFLPPKVNLDLRPKIDIDFAIKIEKEMQKRRKEYIEKPGEYLSMVRKAYGEKEYEKVKKLDIYETEKVLEQYTSREIAEKFFNTKNKASHVRKIYFDIQAKRKQLFG